MWPRSSEPGAITKWTDEQRETFELLAETVNHLEDDAVAPTIPPLVRSRTSPDRTSGEYDGCQFLWCDGTTASKGSVGNAENRRGGKSRGESARRAVED
jgi:hypothetical protein